MVEPNTSRLTETLDLLTHPYRRYTLYRLTNESEVVSVDSLAGVVAEWAGEQTGAGQRTDRNAVEIALRHTHLPKLADKGIVSFRANTDSVELQDTHGLEWFLADGARIDGYLQAAASD